MLGAAFRGCRSLKSITIPDEALNHEYYGIDHRGVYMDPFYGCTQLIAIAKTYKMSVKEYLLHKNERTRMVNLRVTVLTSLKKINNERILARSEGREFIRGDPIGIENRSGNLNGVLAEDRIPPFEIWREIVMFL